MLIHNSLRRPIQEWLQFARMSGNNTTPGSVVRSAISDIKGNRLLRFTW